MVKKGEAVWLFLERARRMSERCEWFSVSVDDLLIVRGELIIPHVFLPPLPLLSQTLTWNSTVLSSIARWGPEKRGPPAQFPTPPRPVTNSNYCLISRHLYRSPAKPALRIPAEMILQ